MWPGCPGASHAHALRDVVDSAQVSKYLDTPVPVSFPGSSRTSLMTSCEASSWAPGLATQKSVVLPVVSPARLVPGVVGSVGPLSPCSSLLASVPSGVPAKRAVPLGAGPALLSRSDDLGLSPRVCREWYGYGRSASESAYDSGWCCLWNSTIFVNAVSERRWYEFLEESCKFTSVEEGHCIAGQIEDITAVPSAPGF